MGKNNKKRRGIKKKNKARRLKNRKKKEAKKGLTQLSSEMFLVQNPFAKLNKKERDEVIQSIGKNSEKIFQESLAKIRKILNQYNPLSLLSILSFYGLSTGVGDNGIQKKDSDYILHQSHLEILQGLIIQCKPEEMRWQPCEPNIVQDLLESLNDLLESNGMRGIEERLQIESKEEKAISLLQFSMRGNTQNVRNWGYFSQVKSISLELYGPFDSLVEKTYGFSVVNIFDLFQLLIDDIETANSHRFKILSELTQWNDKYELVSKYFELIGEASESVELFFKEYQFGDMPLESLRLFLVSHYDQYLHNEYEFHLDNLSDKLDINESIIEKILSEFSFEIGDLNSYETENLFLSNPVWKCPLIKMETKKYFCALPYVFFSFVIPNLNKLIEGIDEKAISERRTFYLEEKIAEIIKKRFPESNTISGLKWKFNDIWYETDLITFIDSHAIIVEAKSGKINDPARRGAPARLKKHIEEILVAPNIQSKRLQKRLEDLIDNPQMEDNLRDVLPIDLNTIHRIIRISISLEDFASIQANVSQLKQTGWLPGDFEPCPTMSLADFETLFDFLDHPVQIIHYLQRRQELEKKLGYMGDELDLMGLYIDTLFNLGDVEPDAELVITGMSFPLDSYYSSKDAGVDIPKPKPKISPLFSGILHDLEARNTHRWTEIGVILSMFSPDDQIRLTKMIEALKINVRKYWKAPGHRNVAIVTPPKASEIALCYIIYNENNAHKRNDYIKVATNNALEPDHVNQCLVIAKNMDKDDLNYHFIGLMKSTS